MAQQLTWTPINPDFSNSNRLRESASRTISEVGDTFGRISDTLNKRIEEDNRQKQLEFTNAMEQQRLGLMRNADERSRDEFLLERTKYDDQVAGQKAKDKAAIIYDNLLAKAYDNKTGTYNMDVFNKSAEEYLANATSDERGKFAEINNPVDLLKLNEEVTQKRGQEARLKQLSDLQIQQIQATLDQQQEKGNQQKEIDKEKMYAFNVAKAQGLNETATLNFVNDHIRRKFGVDDPNISKIALENELKLYGNATTLPDSSYKSLADFAKDYGIPTENRQALYASYELAKTLTGKPKMTESQYLNVMLPKMAYKDPLIGSLRVKGIEEEDIIDAFGLSPKGEPKEGGKVKLDEFLTPGSTSSTGSTSSVPAVLSYTPPARVQPSQEQLEPIWAKLQEDAEQAEAKKQEQQERIKSANKVFDKFSDKVNFDILYKNPSPKVIAGFSNRVKENSNLTTEEKNSILKAIETRFQ